LRTRKILNLKLTISGIIIAIGIISAYAFLSWEKEESNKLDRENALELLSNITPINISEKGTGGIISIAGDSIFEPYIYSGDITQIDEKYLDVNTTDDIQITFDEAYFLLKPENTELYQEIGVAYEPHNSVFVVPIFTMTAYTEPGFYSYFRDECDTTCITNHPIGYGLSPTFQSSIHAIKVLRLLGYPYITDIEIDKNPEILNLFDKVILLHNEYATKEMFEAITQHPKVVYLYPNSLYAEIDVSYENDTITLIRGHSYPSPEIKNGFDWEFDNTQYEFDTECENWELLEIDNGIMLNCYPESIIYQDKDLLKAIKEY